ncbi:hypothetical protein LCGC14_1182400 [marine sediment metagenome]|uniref:Uncharacterized protein n=1 Tax=marine sediment metagenome TaxID=412755 RepID=A0A0F9M9H0_9ZZZZ
MDVRSRKMRLRNHGLWQIGLYETLCFMMVNSHTYIFDIGKKHAQVVSKNLLIKRYIIESKT